VSSIRPMQPSDLRSVVALEAAQQPRPWSESVFRGELEAENRVYLIVEGEDDIAGFGGVMIVGDEAHVTNLLVSDSHRRQGLGRALMLALTEAAIASGARHLTLEVRTGNEAARALYARLGLVPVGIRPRYYGDDDALILWAHDIDRPDYLERLR
ncbi:MAG TPA: ribosomal protein S18-alanine N-acetyltransferase, partial [Acidimicrobiia bacterium]|nr:ribosomal protein S18-alanine N-acetyltransferase [Acidimicrobiia bacterium]